MYIAYVKNQCSVYIQPRGSRPTQTTTKSSASSWQPPCLMFPHRVDRGVRNATLSYRIINVTLGGLGTEEAAQNLLSRACMISSASRIRPRPGSWSAARRTPRVGLPSVLLYRSDVRNLCSPRLACTTNLPLEGPPNDMCNSCSCRKLSRGMTFRYSWASSSHHPGHLPIAATQASRETPRPSAPAGMIWPKIWDSTNSSRSIKPSPQDRGSAIIAPARRRLRS